MFVAREAELGLLESRYRSGRFELVVVYGRRRVGKTRLLTEFVKDKDHVHFFTARQTSAAENLASLCAALLAEHVAGAAPIPSIGGPCYQSFEAALEAFFAQAEDERTMLVIDEYPYLAQAYPGISSLLQTLADAHSGRTAAMVVLCGSSMSFMEHQVLGEKSPLYGRRTAQLKVEPFDFLDAAKMLPCEDPQKSSSYIPW